MGSFREMASTCPRCACSAQEIQQELDRRDSILRAEREQLIEQMEARILEQVLTALGKGGVPSCGTAPQTRCVDVALGQVTKTTNAVPPIVVPLSAGTGDGSVNAGGSDSKKRKRCAVCGDYSAVHKHRTLGIPLDDKCRKQVETHKQGGTIVERRAEWGAALRECLQKGPNAAALKMLTYLEGEAANTDLSAKKPKLNGDPPVADTHCTICCESHEHTAITTLPCNHSFHQKCIVPWLQEKPSCPVCRADVRIEYGCDNEMRIVPCGPSSLCATSLCDELGHDLAWKAEQLVHHGVASAKAVLADTNETLETSGDACTVTQVVAHSCADQGWLAQALAQGPGPETLECVENDLVHSNSDWLNFLQSSPVEKPASSE